MLVYPRYSMRLTELVTPLKPLEAMAMGKPVLASDIGGHREHIRNNGNGLLFTAGSLEALVVALERILNSDELRIRIQDEGRRWVREIKSWDRTTQVYREIYAKVIGNAL